MKVRDTAQIVFNQEELAQIRKSAGNLAESMLNGATLKNGESLRIPSDYLYRLPAHCEFFLQKFAIEDQRKATKESKNFSLEDFLNGTAWDRVMLALHDEAARSCNLDHLELQFIKKLTDQICEDCIEKKVFALNLFEIPGTFTDAARAAKAQARRTGQEFNIETFLNEETCAEILASIEG